MNHLREVTPHVVPDHAPGGPPNRAATSAAVEHDATLASAVRRTSFMRQVFYIVVLLVALAGQVSGAVEALGIPLLWAIFAVGGLELGGIVVLANADVRRRLGEHAIASRLLSATIAAGAVAFNWIAHSNKLHGGFFAGMSALGYLVWLMHTENQRRDRLRAKGDLPPTTPAYEFFAHWVRHPLLTMRAKSLAKANPKLGLYGSLDAARTEARRERRQAAIAKVLHRKIRAVVDPSTADIACATYDWDEIAARLAASADYDGLTALIGSDLHPARLVNSDDDLAAQIEQARQAEVRAVAAADAATAQIAQLDAQVVSALALAESEAQRRADAEARVAEMAAQLAEHEQARRAAETRADELAAQIVQPQPEAAASRATTKRQPSAAERVAKAIARSPKATDATIAARLGLSEATVKRHRRHAVDSLSTPSGRNLHAA